MLESQTEHTRMSSSSNSEFTNIFNTLILLTMITKTVTYILLLTNGTMIKLLLSIHFLIVKFWTGLL